jgi:hypothetical protein
MESPSRCIFTKEMPMPFYLSALLPLFCATATGVAASNPEKSPLVAASKGISATTARSDPTTSDSPLIDNLALQRHTAAGRIAGVSRAPSTAAEPATIPVSDGPTATKSRRSFWRKQHRSAVASIRKARTRLFEAETRLRSMRDQNARPMTLAQRLRAETAVEIQQQRVAELEKTLAEANEAFTSTIRQARLEGGTPDWFRDLPRP